MLHALQPLDLLYGHRVLDTLKVPDVQAVRDAMIPADLCRSTINTRMSRLRRFVRWAIKHQHAKPATILTWDAVDALQYGRSQARETKPILSAKLEAFEAMLPHLPDLVRRMALLQMAAGMQSGELCPMRWDLVDRRADIWVYTPAEHKTEHHGHRRNIVIPIPTHDLLGEPRASGYIFEHGRGGPYKPSSYAQAITKAISIAGCEHWIPHQLRHNAITEWATKGGVEVARLLGG
ncbi:MAG: tyrosine-type recombinase/integrase [Planctomycetota bacterium]